MIANLGKQFQLTVVVVGFFTTLQLIVWQEATGSAASMTLIVTFVIAIACAIRYWWVILLLEWPARWFRTLLLLLAWSALPTAAANAGNAVRWALALAGLSTIGCVTEIYNGVTRQWSIGSDQMSRSLKSDHVIGAALTGLSAVILVGLVVLRPGLLDLVVPVMVVLDCARLSMMIHRHQRFIEMGSLS